MNDACVAFLFLGEKNISSSLYCCSEPLLMLLSLVVSLCCWNKFVLVETLYSCIKIDLLFIKEVEGSLWIVLSQKPAFGFPIFFILLFVISICYILHLYHCI